MEATTRATLAGGSVTALVVGLSLATTGPRPALSLRLPGTLGGIIPLWVVGGLLGGGVAGALARDRFGASNWAFGARYGVAAAGLGLVLAYLGHAAVVVWLAATGELPLHPLTMLTLVPLVVGLPVVPVQLVGGLLAGGLLGVLVGDGPTQEDGEVPEPAPPEYDADRLERLGDHARYAPDRVDHDALLSFLDSAAPEARAEAARAVAAAPEPTLEGFVEGLPRLVALLEDERSVRRPAAAAIAALARIAPDAAAEHTDVLVGALSDPSARVREEAGTALGAAAAAAPERVVEATAPLLGDEDRTTRRAAATVLLDATRAEPAVVRQVAPALIEALDRDGFARDPLVEALAVLADHDPDAVAPAADSLTALAGEDGPAGAATEALARVAAADPDAVRDATPVLVDALVAAPNDTLAEGIVALGATAPETREAIEERLRGAERWDRYRAARALADAGDPGPAIAAAVVDEPLERYLDR